MCLLLKNIYLSFSLHSALRTKLGLKPLDTTTKSANEEKESLKDDVHKPAVNIAEVKRSEAIREKMAAAKEKRKLNQKLGLVGYLHVQKLLPHVQQLLLHVQQLILHVQQLVLHVQQLILFVQQFLLHMQLVVTACTAVDNTFTAVVTTCWDYVF